ncbi:ABC transporter type 1, transmembrane domain-containing protein [Staphylotrichum tortipilum]|uniref:ABC transporter type 1, transmembrane domain-containing protein n=1 Tax=Staphylotrichum tortipilum TaxID=2831512 RepID=A0AAN6MLZ6_9PEZI|nr:ABC transporter type 1, transmembrane domain-containing protein [Staphylotrichum longicolle]
MVPIHTISVANAAVFVVCFPFQLWVLHGSRRASLAAAPGLVLLLHREQRHSDLAAVYLLAAVLCDLVALTVPSASRVDRPPPGRCFLHGLLLGLEVRPRLCSGRHGVRLALEDESGVLGRLFFAWINPVLVRGYRGLLHGDELPGLGRGMGAKRAREGMLEAWEGRARPETRGALPLALLRCVRWGFAAPVVPRLFVILFRYSQPGLIRRAIQFVAANSLASADSLETRGYWLVISVVAVYVGLAVSTAAYQHCLNKLRIVTKSALVGTIHDKALSLPSAAHDGSEAATLMSTDAVGLEGVAEMFHEMWAQSLEVGIGIVLLSREVGWIWPLPLILIFLCSRMSRYVAEHLHPGQKAWNEATQQRVAATSSMLSSMKVIKMLGLQHCLANSTRRLRKKELEMASRVRWIMVYYNASANALGIFSPAITLALFALVAARKGRALNVETAFTTMAILSMVTHPANMVMTIVPRVVAAFAGFERVEAYLLRPRLLDERQTHPTVGKGAFLAIDMQSVTLGEPRPILTDVNIEVAHGSLTIVSGPVGSGKSTLLRAILGEARPAQGHIELSTRRVVYCAQTPWLPTGTIKQAICGMGGVDSRGDSGWYRRVVKACCLEHDLDLLPEGDGTQIGSGGLNLSGGQRQRVALARGLFARCNAALLDDVFSALDGDTETRLFRNLFGPEGLFRQTNTAVVLVTNCTQFFPAADQIVILEGGGVKAHGNWEAIKHHASSSISKFSLQEHQADHIDDPAKASSPATSRQLQATQEARVDLARNTGDLGLYRYYFRFVGMSNLALLAGFTASYSLFITLPQHWLKLWTEPGGQSQGFYVCGFIILSLMSWISTNGTMWSTVIRIAPHSGLRVHSHLLGIVASAPLSFFSGNDNGSILSRFTQDLQLIDKQLPPALANLGNQIFKLLMQLVLLCMAQKWLALSLPACAGLVYVIQKVYLRASRQLRFLELESRAAVLSTFLESVEGVETIRAFGWVGKAADQNAARLEDSQRPEFLLMCLQRWLNLTLDMIAAAVAVGIIAAAVALRGRVSGGQVGVALNIMLVANTTLLRLVESWTTLEVSLGAVARLKALESTTPSEADKNAGFEPPWGWPQGRIELKRVTAAYNPDAVALRDLTLSIPGGQQLTICGRTGSGKSSLLLTLLRMLDIQSGRIELDGVDITQIPRDVLRQKCFVTVSQEGLLFPSETLRFNFDPEGLLGPNGGDREIVDTLKRASLWAHFYSDITTTNDDSKNTSHNNNNPLNQPLSFFPPLSAGQAQLLGLCRGVLKASALRRQGGRRAVLLLDEVTAALDAGAEGVVRRMVEEEFVGKGHTVVVVSHRVVGGGGGDGGAVVCMKDGRIVGAGGEGKGVAG